MSTKKHAPCRCSDRAVFDLIGASAEGGRVWRCCNCFYSVPVRKRTKAETPGRIAAKEWIEQELARREAARLALAL